MNTLRRHQLVWLDEYGWYRILAAASTQPAPAPDLQVLACLELWAERRWPLVVTRQAVDPATASPDTPLALGLAAPSCWGRRALTVTASARAVVRHGEFAAAADFGPSLPATARAGWTRLCEDLARLGVAARVYGSHGWQRLTGLDYVHAQSDIDLQLDVAQPAQADQVCALLQGAALGALRIDGELAFNDGASVAWREWLRLRAGETDRVLVKRIASVTLEDARGWMAAA